MYNIKKITALLLTFIMVFSIMLNPFSAVYASATNMKPPKIDLPKVDLPKVEQPSTTGPSITLPPSNHGLPSMTTAPLDLEKVLPEAPARARGVNYEFKDEVKKLPQNFNYEFKNMTLDQLTSITIGDGKAINRKPHEITPDSINLHEENIPGITIETSGKESEKTIESINGIKYPPGSKILAISQAMSASFSPEINEIYVDEENGNAFRILDILDADAQGNPQYVVETPQLTEVFKSYSIPQQTINLTTGNIAYIDPDFELSPESGMPKNYTAKADGSVVYEDQVVKVTTEGNKHILNLKSNVLIFEYPPKDLISDKDKKKFEGDKEKVNEYSDLRGVENESDFRVTVRVKEGSNIIIEDPRLDASLDLNLLTSQLDAKFAFNSKAIADVTLVGDLVFNYTLEKCVYGYDVNLGKVGNKEKGNTAFIGIFLVLGLNGKVQVEVRTVTTGDAEAGFAYKSVGWGSLPYYVGPYAIFRPASFDMSFTVDGEVHATLACVPQVGVIIWGIELGVLQVWVGFKSTARFHFEGGGGSSTEANISGNGSIDLRAFGNLVAYLFKNKYDIFYIEFPIYYGEWKIGEEVSGSGGDMVKEVAPYVRVTADAYTDLVEGIVDFSTAGKIQAGYQGNNADMDTSLKPYANQSIVLEVYDKNNNLKFSRSMTTDAEGKFTIQFTGNENIFPADKIYINVPRTMGTEVEEFNLGFTTVPVEKEVDTTPIIEIDNRKFRVVGKSAEIKPTVPFTLMDFNVDTFNDVITGWVSGDYSGSLSISIDKYIDGNNKVTDIQTANVQNGIFKLDYPIDQSTDWVSVFIDYEGSKYGAGPKLRNLDALTITTFNDFTDYEATPATNESGGINPSITLPDRTKTLPNSITQTQERLDRLATRDASGKRLIRPSKVIGTIINKGEMAWLTKHGDDYVRPEGNAPNVNYFNGNVKIKEIHVESALEELFDMLTTPIRPGLPKPKPNIVLYEATTQTKQEMGFRKVSDSNSPVGFTMQSYPTSTGRFEFDKPELVAYEIEIEHEGLNAKYVYNPFMHHYESSGGGSSQQSMEDFIGPLKEATTLVTQDRIDSVVNPADTMNQWQGTWLTQMGKMNLMQKGTAITGTITQGKTEYTVEGTVSDGVFIGSYIAPSTSGSLFGDIVSFEMNISTDGKSIDFRTFDAGANLNSLKGTKAIRQ